jgi:putative membrane protein
MWWNDGWGGWWFFMPLATIAFWAAVTWVVVTLLRGRPGPSQPGGARPTGPEEILAQRYARGEIEDDEYRHRLDTLRHGQSERHQP